MGQLCLGCKDVQVVRQVVDQVPEPFIVNGRKAVFDGIRQIVTRDIFMKMCGDCDQGVVRPTWLRRMPMPSMSISIVSPGCIHTGGLRA